MNKPKIGILTTFAGCDFGYSLVNVVHVQLQMLIKANYAPVLYVAPSFKGEGVFSDRTTEIRRHVQGDATKEDILSVMRPMIGDIDVMFCHDLLFLGQHREWAGALRVLAVEFPHIAWLHWQHSRGDHAPVEPMERSWFCYPNLGDLGHVATINSTSMGKVRYIPHPLDIRYMEWPELAVQIAEDYDFPFVDVSMVMPSRLDRQKQIDKLVRVFAGLKLAGRSVCLIVADAYATGERFLTYKAECLELAKSLGLTDKEFVFLGEKYDECKYSTPRDVVKALFEMSNLFIQPSTSETSSLVVMEAALAGNLVIINADFPPIHHLYGKALTLPFGSIFEATKYYRNVTTADGKVTRVEDLQLYWNDRAKDTILPALDSQITLLLKRQQLKERWPSRVMKNNLEPLIEHAWKETKANAPAIERGDPDVTAIITTLDNLPLLERQIEILKGEVRHIIVVNNGSIDGTKEWLEENDLPGVSFINRGNFGAGPGRNAGINLWAQSTPYTLMVDGGILPPIGGVKILKEYLLNHPEAHVISPEVETCFTTDEKEATLIAPALPADLACFQQRCLSSTAYCLCRAVAWDGLRFSEEGPFGEPGWGTDDNEMSYRWDTADIIHHEFTNGASGWKLYRRASGSFKRLFEETGIYPNQYGSVYEKRNVKCKQDWRALHAGIYGVNGIPSVSYVIKDVPMPEFAKLVKRLHDDPQCEIVASDYDPEVTRWLDTFALRWPWGDVTIDPDGKKLVRGVDYPDELWSGDVVRNRGPLIDALVITPVNMGEYLEPVIQA